MTAALEGGEWSAARPGRTLPPGKTWYPFYRRLSRPQGRSGRAENLVPTGIRSLTVQPVAQSLYRLMSYPAHCNVKLWHKICASNQVRIKLHKFCLMAFRMPITRDCGLVCSSTEVEGSASPRLLLKVSYIYVVLAYRGRSREIDWRSTKQFWWVSKR